MEDAVNLRTTPPRTRRTLFRLPARPTGGLDTNNLTTPGSPQNTFLSRDLAASTGGKFVVFHSITSRRFAACFQATSSRSSQVRVDIVFNGHDHELRAHPAVTPNQPARRARRRLIVRGGEGRQAGRDTGSPLFGSWCTSRRDIDAPRCRADDRLDGRWADSMTS